jgi:L-malate glycosyltransferase
MKRSIVVFVQPRVTHYRKRFWELLRERLSNQGVDLRLLVDDPDQATRSKKDLVTLDWAEAVPSRRLRVGSRYLLWQPILRRVRGADLVIVEQASRHLANYALIAWQYWRGPAIAFWGHGADLTGESPSCVGELLKRYVSRRPSWWFAYTAHSARIVRELGYDSARITVVNNSTDTRAITAARSEFVKGDTRHASGKRARTAGAVAAFVGSIYPEKRISFLLEAARLVKSQLPDFSLLVIGAGPDSERLRAQTAMEDWVCWLGPRTGAELVEATSTVKLLLLPGLVGLVAVDSFALGIPIVTTDYPHHAPEVSYLDDGVNAIIVKPWHNVQQYATAVVDLLSDEVTRARLVQACLDDSTRYTVEEMASRVANGVLSAMHRDPVHVT